MVTFEISKSIAGEKMPAGSLLDFDPSCSALLSQYPLLLFSTILILSCQILPVFFVFITENNPRVESISYTWRATTSKPSILAGFVAVFIIYGPLCTNNGYFLALLLGSLVNVMCVFLFNPDQTPSLAQIRDEYTNRKLEDQHATPAWEKKRVSLAEKELMKADRIAGHIHIFSAFILFINLFVCCTLAMVFSIGFSNVLATMVYVSLCGCFFTMLVIMGLIERKWTDQTSRLERVFLFFGLCLLGSISSSSSSV